MTSDDVSAASSSRRVLLLAGQAFALGLTVAWITIPGSAIFLDTYGSGLLPVTYLGAAAAGATATALLGRALRRRPLAWVAMRVLAGMALVLAASWVLLWRSGADWVSFALLVLVPILVPVGFVFVVGQAGMLLDVRALKTLYPRVIAGFALGFVAGGLVGPPLLALLGRTEHLLAAAAAAAVLFLVLVAATRRSFRAELSTVDHGSDDIARPTLRSLLSNRYVVLIMAFQMLSAVESQWLDYLVYDRAGQRYQNSEELARFVSRFSVIAYGSDIIFLLIVAGLLLRRFGLRYGLTANPFVVLALVAAAVTASIVGGSGTTIVFVLVVATRVSDLVLSDGSTRTSLSAAYQAIATPQRLAAQANVEGLAVPVAIGFSGLVLLVVRAAVGTNGIVLPILTSVVLVGWIVVALCVFRGYRVNLLANLRHRVLDPVELTIDGAHTMTVIDRLLDSDDDRDVRLGLHTLTVAQHPELSMRLERLALHDRATVRSDALDRLVHVDSVVAAMAARRGLDHHSAGARAASLRALAIVGIADDVAAIASRAEDADDEVKLAAAIAMSRIGDDDDRRDVAAMIVELARSEQAHHRVLAARMVEGCDTGVWMNRSPLRALLGDPDHDVVNAALAAIRWPDDVEVLVDVMARLEDRRTAGAAVDTLARGGAAALVLVDEGLSGRTGLGREGQELLARVCRSIDGPDAVMVLRRHVEHRNREVGLAVMGALAALVLSETDRAAHEDDTATDAPQEPAESAVVRADLEHATYVLRALVELDALMSASALRAALNDELVLLRRRVLAALSIRYGADGMSRVAYQFAQRNTRAHAMALEWLDVTLSGSDRAAVALLEPGLTPDAQLRALTRSFPIAPSTVPVIVRDLVEDRDSRWRRPWIAACALLAASEMPEVGLDALTLDLAADPLPTESRENAIIHETLAGLRRRQTA
ncbi:MAG: hypothetical protein ABI658_04510 [Acidimicrobiales bacterium]